MEMGERPLCSHPAARPPSMPIPKSYKNHGHLSVPISSPQMFVPGTLPLPTTSRFVFSFALWDLDFHHAPFITGKVFSPSGTRKHLESQLAVFHTKIPGWKTLTLCSRAPETFLWGLARWSPPRNKVGIGTGVGNPRRLGVLFQLKSSCASQWEGTPSPGMLRGGLLAAWLTAFQPQVLPLAPNLPPSSLPPPAPGRPRQPHLRLLHTSCDLPKRRLLPKRQKHNLQSHLVSHTCPFSFPIPSPRTSLDPFGAESQAAPRSARSVPATALSLPVLSVPPQRAGMGQERGWMGWKSCPKTQRDLPSWCLALV